MEYRVNETELALLAFLHENAEGFGEEFFHKMDVVMSRAGLSTEELAFAASYLEGWGLLGRRDDLRVRGGPPYPALFLTSLGEAYMREVDEMAAEAGLVNRGKRLGVAGLKTIGDAAVKIGTAVLTEVAKSMVKHG